MNIVGFLFNRISYDIVLNSANGSLCAFHRVPYPPRHSVNDPDKRSQPVSDVQHGKHQKQQRFFLIVAGTEGAVKPGKNI